MNYKNLLYLDIETVSKYSSIDELKNNDERGYNLFKRKINRKSDKITDWKENESTVYFNKSPLIPEFGKIVCISLSYYRNNEIKTKSIFGHNEEEIIRESQSIFSHFSNKTIFGLCGFYIKGFDIPFINRKILKYNLEIPKLLKTFNVKPWDMNICDLSEIWKSNGNLETTSFDEMLYELELESPKQDICGSEVNKIYWENDDLDRIKNYCECDVKSVMDTTKKISHLI
jgi:hypothetical protein